MKRCFRTHSNDVYNKNISAFTFLLFLKQCCLHQFTEEEIRQQQVHTKSPQVKKLVTDNMEVKFRFFFLPRERFLALLSMSSTLHILQKQNSWRLHYSDPEKNNCMTHVQDKNWMKEIRVDQLDIQGCSLNLPCTTLPTPHIS